MALLQRSAFAYGLHCDALAPSHWILPDGTPRLFLPVGFFQLSVSHFRIADVYGWFLTTVGQTHHLQTLSRFAVPLSCRLFTPTT